MALLCHKSLNRSGITMVETHNFALKHPITSTGITLSEPASVLFDTCQRLTSRSLLQACWQKQIPHRWHTNLSKRNKLYSLQEWYLALTWVAQAISSDLGKTDPGKYLDGRCPWNARSRKQKQAVTISECPPPPSRSHQKLPWLPGTCTHQRDTTKIEGVI